MKKLLFVLATLFMTSCGGGSGVDGDKYADELTAEEVKQYCEWAVDVSGGAQEKMCSAEVTASFPSLEECLTQARGHCQIKVYEECQEAVGDDPCAVFSEPKCLTNITACAAAQM